MISRHLAFVWLRVHGVTGSWCIVVLVCWAASVALAWVGLPPLDPSPVIEPVNLQQIGIVALATVAGVTSLAIHDDAPWLTRRKARSFALLREGWMASLSLAYVGVGILGGQFLPPGLPPVSGFLAVAVLWWSIAVLAGSLLGRLPGLLVPLGCAVLATSKVVPWRQNVVFHPDLGDLRLVCAGLGMLVAALVYGTIGSARSRARLGM